MPTAHQSEVPEPDSMTIDPANLGSVDPLSVEGIFLVALGKTGAEREAFLGAQCVDDDQRQRVEALLGAYEKAGNFLQKPAVAAEPTPICQYLSPSKVPGTIGRLGSYEIIEEIGRGGMGVVFRAHDPKLQRIVAVKALAPELARLPSARQRFLREARAAAAISHPHVVTIFAVEGTEEASLGTERTTLPFLVMECIVGQTLHDKIKRVGALRLEEIIRISRQMAEGLAAAHKRGLIHRDIKPANILLENGVERVKITDFGLARTTADGGITHTGEILGTPQCMSPEQARGEIVDQRSDLFSLGCVMYTMCTGVSPFRGDNILAVMKKVCEDSPPSVSQLNPDIPSWLCELVHRLLEKDPNRRVQSAQEIVEILEARSIAHRPFVPQPQPTVEPAASRQAELDGVSKWLLTPVPDNLEQWLFKDHLLPVTLIALILGFICGDNKFDVVAWLPVIGCIVIGSLVLLKIARKLQWSWVNWKSSITIPLAMLLGGMGRAWLVHLAKPNTNAWEAFAKSNASLAVFLTGLWLVLVFRKRLKSKRVDIQGISYFPSFTGWPSGVWWFLFVIGAVGVINTILAQQPLQMRIGQIEVLMIVGIVTFGAWLTVQLVAAGVKLARIREAQPSTVSSTTAASSAIETTTERRSPWSILGWLLIGMIGVGLAGSLLFAAGIAIPYFMARQSPLPSPGRVILETHGHTLSKVTFGGQQVQSLDVDAQDRPTFIASQGAHLLTVEYLSEKPELELVFSRTIDVNASDLIVDAKPLARPITRTPPSPAGNSVAASTTSGATTTFPLADSVEVLTDPTQMPAPAIGMIPGHFGAPYEQEMTQAVWIDEPGLLIRMKRIGFEGEEGQLEYFSKVSWGTGPFMAVNELGEHPHHFPSGRYQVLVQDLDYGWPIDRRGTITIGNGPMYVHVRRSFAGQQKMGSGSDQYPLSFRWAGKTYQIETPEEVSIVNGLLAATHPSRSVGFKAPKSFHSHPLFLDAVQTDSNTGEHSLKHQRTLAKIEIQSHNMQAGFMSPLGQIAWRGPRQPTDGVFVPASNLSMFVKDELIGWNSQSWSDVRPVSPGELASASQIARRDRALIKEFAETPAPEDYITNNWFRWCGEETAGLDRKTYPAIQRLLIAWADGQPDVAESELVQLGGATSFEDLWRRVVPSADEQKFLPSSDATDRTTSKFAPPEFIVPGTTAGSWRMKEPREGAFIPNE